MKSIEIKNLTKKFKERVAVNNLSLDINEGEFFALLGQNGAGKTTTIKMLCCLTMPSSGDALVMGNSITKEPLKVKQIINVSPQETAVAPNLSIKENLEFICEVYGNSKTESIKKANEMLVKFKLKDRENDKAKTLSGGMQRRLSIAMALISDPKILFLDEPTLGLDVRARNDLWEILLELKGKITIILTTHYLEEADKLADRIAIMHNGSLKALGTSKELEKLSNKNTLEDAFLSLTEEDNYEN